MMKGTFSVWSLIFILLGVIAVLLAIRGILIGSVPFIGRNDVVYLLKKEESVVLFWFIEVFYIIGGSVSILYGAKTIKEENHT